ncbi:MAG: M23 family metallopeptidase, partial [Microthrixaceae bacterium]
MTGDAVLGILWLIGALLAPQRAEVIASPMTEMLAPQRAEVIASPMTEMSSTGTGTGGDAVDPTHSIAYRPPVDRPISGGFHLESGQYGAGRRGIQYETVQGDQVRAAAGGIVTFAGAVVGRVSVTISHADGRRSTVTGLIEVGVKVDQIVLGGQVIA